MAQLVGLQGDANDAVQMRSLSIIQLEDIKHANFLDNRLCDGVELITYLQKRSCHRTWATVNNSANNFPVSLMGTLYISCFRSHKKRRTDFLTSLLRRCDTHCNITESLKYDSALESEKILKDFGNSPSSIGSSPSSGGIRRRGGLDSNRYPPNINSTEAKVEFLATTLAYIPFAVQDEVLLIISWLNRNTTVQTELFLKRFRDILMTRGAIIRQEGAMQGPMEGSALSFKRNAEHSSMDKIISSVGNPDGCVLDDTLLFDEEAFQCYIQCNVTTMKLDSALELYGAEARCRERLILVKHFLKYAYNLSSTLCVAYASEGKVVDKSRRPKKRPAKLKIKNSEISDHDADDVKEIVDMLPQVANDESGSTTVKLGVGWETSLIVSEHGVNHPFTALLPPVGGDSECYVNAGNFPSGKKQVNIQSPVKRRLDNWIDADHVTLSGTVANVDYTRQLIRKAIKDFNRLLTLHFNGFEHHAQKSSPGKKRMKRIVETDDETSGKMHRKTKRRRLSMKASDISDDEDFCENNDDNDEYVP